MPPTSEGVVIVNTSPLLYLHRIGRLGLLESLFGRVVVPAAVEAELNAGRSLGIDVPVAASIRWVSIVPPKTQLLTPMHIDLGPGETEVLALAVERSARLVILDDRLGRRMASMLAIPIAGTAGILLKAAQLRLIPDLEAELRALQRNGMWLSDAVVAAILADFEASNR